MSKVGKNVFSFLCFPIFHLLRLFPGDFLSKESVVIFLVNSEMTLESTQIKRPTNIVTFFFF